jgi:hypothetical protein
MPLEPNFNNMCTWQKAPHFLNPDSLFNRFSCLLGQKIIFLWNLTFHDCLYGSQLSEPTFRQSNAIYTLPKPISVRFILTLSSINI